MLPKSMSMQVRKKATTTAEIGHPNLASVEAGRSKSGSRLSPNLSNGSRRDSLSGDDGLGLGVDDTDARYIVSCMW